MLKNILNFEGVTLLNKEEQKNVAGGLRSSCALIITNSGGGTEVFEGMYYGSTYNGISTSANNACVKAIQDGATRCKYDCAYDGIG